MDKDCEILNKLLDLQSQSDFRFYLVGGCVRNLLIGADIQDIDLVCRGNFEELIQVLSQGFKLEVSLYKTIALTGNRYLFDLATPRKESYPQKNGVPMPDFSADLCEDINRRDFTVNTAMIPLDHEVAQWFLEFHPEPMNILEKVHLSHSSFLEDLQNRQLRILHKNSFKDDPSRMMRAIKYQVLYGFEFAPETASAFNPRLIEQLEVSRFMKILWLYSREKKAKELFCSMEEYGIISGFSSFYVAFEQVKQGWKLEKIDWQPIYFLLKFFERVNGLSQLSSDFTRLVKDIQVIKESLLNSECIQNSYILYKTLYNKRCESIIYCYMLGIGREEIEAYMCNLREINLQVSGKDVLELGVENGPRVGALLDQLLCHKVTGLVDMSKKDEIDWIKQVRDEY